MSILAMPSDVVAQTDALFSQYYETPTYYNPAAAGQTDFLRIRGGSRMQWVGVKHAPTTFMLTGDMPFKVGNKRIGVGAVLQQESIGLYDNLGVALQGGYRFKALKGELTAAISVGFLDKKFKGSEVYIPDDDDFHESTDDAIPRTDVHGTSIDLGLGVFYTHRRFWAGLSALHLNSPTVTFSSDAGTSSDGSVNESAKNFEFQAGRTLYFMAGSNIAVKNTLFEVIPSMIVASDFTFTTAEVTARLRYNKFLIGGVGYRWDDAVTLHLGAEIKGFYLGYAYDYPTSAIAKVSSGSHEVFVGYSLKLDLSDKNKNKHKSIRIM